MGKQIHKNTQTSSRKTEEVEEVKTRSSQEILDETDEVLDNIEEVLEDSETVLGESEMTLEELDELLSIWTKLPCGCGS